jgi:hypothetical protein
MARACVYLKTKAPISISGRGGRKALAGVCSHLVVFLGLSPPLAAHLLVSGPDPWNQRCRDEAGAPYPWTERELLRACDEAVDSIPTAGVKAWERDQKRAMRDKTLSTFFERVAAAQCQEAGYVLAMDLHHRFQDWSGLEVSETAFGLAAKRAGLKKKTATKARIRAYCHLTDSAVAAALAGLTP